jgi:peptidyl-prolyl cis-trans isomerase B (cyclophilin B)
MKKFAIAALAVLCAALMIFMTACNGGGGKTYVGEKFNTPKKVPSVHPEVTITMKDGNVIKLELYPEYAPNTVCNFVSLVKSGYYDGLLFHRIVKGFMIQAGDAAGTGEGDPGFTIQGEFSSNGYEKNTLGHEEGVISMARIGENTTTGEKNYDTAATQFFIMDASSRSNSKSLDGNYAAFGKVTEGIDFVHTYAARNADSETARPYDIPTIKAATVDTKGADFPEPIRDGEALTPEYVKNPTTAPVTTPAPTDAAAVTSTAAPTSSAAPSATSAPAATSVEDVSKRMTATITMEDGGKIVLALYPEKAPNTVQNFVELVKAKFYDGVIFHRVVQGFMVQTGDKTGTGSGDVGWTIKGEFSANGDTVNDMTYDAGVVGMARLGENASTGEKNYDSASTQFFITDSAGNKASLDGQYAAFAKVIEGMDIVRQISALVTDANDRPLEPPKIKTITVDTKNFEVPSAVRITTAQ